MSFSTLAVHVLAVTLLGAFVVADALSGDLMRSEATTKALTHPHRHGVVTHAHARQERPAIAQRLGQHRNQTIRTPCDIQKDLLPKDTSKDSLDETWAAMKVGNIEAQKSSPPLDESLLSQEVGTDNKWLVFTSAGDAGNVGSWTTGGDPRFDVFAAYYGQQEDGLSHLRSQATLAWSSKGSKSQNLFYAMTSPYTQHLFEQYSAVLVCDDDIDLDVPRVHQLFQAHKKYDMQVLGPSFAASGHKWWHSGLHVANSFLRYGAFVEVTCPLFTMSALKDFMSTVYHPTLVGGGVDWLYIYYFNLPSHPRRWGVLDAVQVHNPRKHKNGIREITMVESLAKNHRALRNYRRKYNLLGVNGTQWGSCASYLAHQWRSTFNYSCGRILMDHSRPEKGGEYVDDCRAYETRGKKRIHRIFTKKALASYS